MKSSAILVACLVLVSPSLCEDSTESSDTPFDTNFYFLESFVESTETTINNLTTLLNDANDVATALLEKEISKINSTVVDAIDEVITSIEGRVDEAANKTFTCVNEQSAAADTVIQDAISGSVECFTNKVEEVLDNIAKLTSYAQSAVTVLSNARESAQECVTKKLLIAPLCLTKVGATVATQHTTLAAKSALVIAKTTSLISTLNTSLPTCVGLNAASSAAKIGVIVGKIAYCAVSSD